MISLASLYSGWHRIRLQQSSGEWSGLPQQPSDTPIRIFMRQSGAIASTQRHGSGIKTHRTAGSTGRFARSSRAICTIPESMMWARKFKISKQICMFPRSTQTEKRHSSGSRLSRSIRHQRISCGSKHRVVVKSRLLPTMICTRLMMGTSRRHERASLQPVIMQLSQLSSRASHHRVKHPNSIC